MKHCVLGIVPSKVTVLLLSLLLTACATGPADRQVTIATATGNGQEFPGAICSVSTNSRSWNVATPVTLKIPASGDLRIVCNKAGYRTSELRMPPIGQGGGGSSMGVGVGGGSGNVGMGLGFSLPIGSSGSGYPPRIRVTMSPQ
ncbi:MAG TPA: hypothetical protein VI140_01905 [Oxalicibacterium sp.]